MKTPRSSRQVLCVGRILVVSALLFFHAANLSAAQVGKIAGRVTQEGSGEALIDANILIEGTSLGAATNLDGDYYIINVPAGTYDVTASLVGYASQRITEVEVNSGRTTRLDFALKPSFIPMEEVIVTWEKPPVDLQETSARAVVRQEEIQELPVQTVGQILELQAGATTDASGQLHVRGGRSGEIVYYVDGQRIEDPISGLSQPFVNREAVEELTLLSGTFNAEYGDAMSGIVQIITREGGEKLHVNVEYLSPMVNNSPYRKVDWAGPESDAMRDPETGKSSYRPNEVLDQPINIADITGRLAMTIGGHLRMADRTSYFLSTVVRNEDSYLPFGWDQERTLQGKMTKSYGSGGKVTLSFGTSWENYQLYNHDWKYVPDHYHKHFVRDQRVELQWTHSLSRQAFFNVVMGTHWQKHDAKLFEDWQDYITAGYQPKDFTFDFYGDSDWSDTWQDSRTTTYSLSANATYQYGNYHLFKAGIEDRIIHIKMYDIRELVIGPDLQPSGIVDYYAETPVELAAYLQDKIELPYLVVNAGLRWDYVDPHSKGWSIPENPDSGLAEAPSSQQFSPRLGLAHPIGENLSLYFAYGHFFQYPNYVNLFMNSADLNPDTLAERSFDAVGNRMLKPQRTVAYEVGLKGNLADNLGFTVTAYYKDITDLVGTKQVRLGTKYNYALFRNIDYASVVGIELGLRRTLSDHWSFEGNYNYSVAKGNSSEPLEGFWNVYYEQPEARQEYYLDFDRRHVINALLIWRSGPLKRDDYLSFLTSDVTLGVTASWASGLPYTPYTGAGEQLALTNSARMDPTATVDVRFSKILAHRPVKVSLLAYIDNLFNYTNDLVVDSRTGEPWESPVASDEVAYDQLHDPSRVDAPRTIKIGLSAQF